MVFVFMSLVTRSWRHVELVIAFVGLASHLHRPRRLVLSVHGLGAAFAMLSRPENL